MDTLIGSHVPKTYNADSKQAGNTDLSAERKKVLRLVQEGLDDVKAGRVYPGPETLQAIFARHGL
ncbi:hypothetical protein [Mobiluncus mulieris]|uniref:hypothetical protein n=1 Tax=Mobiluncus mulieris TaxID=2052 RepID=UPI0021E2EB40|nr:hypothetical protein [Mobiluncus mulieris]MCU9972724.1 hypothetical protein [Mobiluncus mulieris]